MLRSLSFVVLVSLPFVTTAANAKQNCVHATEYLTEATARFEVDNRPEGIELLQLSIDTCPTFAAYAKLGEEYAKSLERSDRALAVAAFVKAHEIAPNGRAQAAVLYQYANLLVADGDPQNAYPLIKQARRLDSTNQDIETLDAALEKEIQSPTVQQLTRGLAASLYQPLRAQSAATRPARTGAATKSPQVATTGPSISIQINFETGSNLVDEATRPNVSKLAEALAERPTSERFVFVGHADERGTEALNMPLSLDRARAIRESIIQTNPSLANRIEVIGRGSAEPLEAGSNESAWKKNRRIQVFLDKR